LLAGLEIRLLRKRIADYGYGIASVVPPQIFSKSWSQCGEDLIIQYVFNLRGIKHPSYIDIGAHHPFYLSNTALFYEQGCRGINVEANPGLIGSFIKHRPNDINLNVGAGNTEGELDFYIMKEDSLSTFSKSECDAMILQGKQLQEVKKIKLTTISKILNEHFENRFPDFMSIDAEGWDLTILKSIDFEKYWPRVICVEAADYSPTGSGKRRDEVIDFLVTKGYYEYANTNLNAIMVKNEFWFV
jgi:FkbM family methyltransferase